MSRTASMSQIELNKKGKARNGQSNKKNKVNRNNESSTIDKIGLFSEMGYLPSGHYDYPYKDAFLFERTKGKQFATAPPKTSHYTSDGYFSKSFIHIFDSDAYCDLILLRRRQRIQELKKAISEKPFAPSSVPQKPSGSGSVYGTIRYQFPLKDDGKHTTPKENNRIPKQYSLPSENKGLKNFVTNPPKKGSGYGFVDVCLSKPPPYKESDYENPHKLHLQEMKFHKSKLISNRPFISSSKSAEYFDTKISRLESHSSVENLEITKKKGSKKAKAPEPESSPEPDHQSTLTKKKEKQQVAAEEFPPFLPSNPPRTGIYGTINRYPKAMTPLPKETKAPPASPAPVFRPAGGLHSFPIRSVVEMNLPHQPTDFTREHSLTLAFSLPPEIKHSI